MKAGRTGDVPRELQNVHADTSGQEREQGYLYPHNFTGHWVRQQYLPDAIRDERFYIPTENGYEKKIKMHLEHLRNREEEENA